MPSFEGKGVGVNVSEANSRRDWEACIGLIAHRDCMYQNLSSKITINRNCKSIPHCYMNSVSWRLFTFHVCTYFRPTASSGLKKRGAQLKLGPLLFANRPVFNRRTELHFSPVQLCYKYSLLRSGLTAPCGRSICQDSMNFDFRWRYNGNT